AAEPAPETEATPVAEATAEPVAEEPAPEAATDSVVPDAEPEAAAEAVEPKAETPAPETAALTEAAAEPVTEEAAPEAVEPESEPVAAEEAPQVEAASEPTGTVEQAETTPEAEPEAEPVAVAVAVAEEPAPASATEPEPALAPVPAQATESDPAPTPVATAEPAEATPVATAEPSEPSPTAAAPVATAQPADDAPVATAQPADDAPVATAQPSEDVSAPASDATPVTIPTAEPVVAAAADGEDAPQGPPAVDDESRTGGAGGDTGAEGGAEAVERRPVPAGLRSAYQAAASVLENTHLTGTRAHVYLVLDRSASMRPYYKDGSAQALAEQTLALAAHLDPENTTVHVVFFSTELDGTGELTLPAYENKIDDLHAGLGRMGRTSYHAAVDAVLAHYDENATPGAPALVVFQTDGAPDAKTPATQSLTDAAKSHTSVFFSFVGFGDHDNKAFDYLRKLKTDNTAFFHAGPTPLELTDAELYDGLLIDWRP
ncbi:TerF vWA domain-containing protein, partial [Streptomyces sp. yr375]|uniref:VWA domain-containing protein n=1 Tax=Streptomyces sp. yr375 TaxID=1761906 RepID=UPI0008B9E9D8